MARYYFLTQFVMRQCNSGDQIPHYLINELILSWYQRVTKTWDHGCMWSLVSINTPLYMYSTFVRAWEQCLIMKFNISDSCGQPFMHGKFMCMEWWQIGYISGMMSKLCHQILLLFPVQYVTWSVIHASIANLTPKSHVSHYKSHPPSSQAHMF